MPKLSKGEVAEKWEHRIESAKRVKKAWMDRFRVPVLYQYYEGFQHLLEMDENNRPYVVNLIYSTIEQKLPNLIFDNPTFKLAPRPVGYTYDMDQAIPRTQLKEDALNFVCSREEFGLNDKHELAVLDAFFGFGVLLTDYDEDRCENPYLTKGDKDPLNHLYCRHIPFDQFYVSANANWDLSKGRWYGFWDDVPFERLQKYIDKGKLNEPPAYSKYEDDFAALPSVAGKITLGEPYDEIVPAGHYRLWYIWDFEEMKKYVIALDHAATLEDRILEYEDFEHTPISTVRFGKRRKGWYPLPPVFNWLSPQDEINDIRQTHKIHRKRYSRKYQIIADSMDPEEEDKFLYGPDGTAFKVNRPDAIKAVEDAPLDSSNQQSLIVSYDDMNRVSGTSDEQRAVADRQTATQSTIINQRAMIRESKDLMRIGNFLVSFAKNVLRALGKSRKAFWIKVAGPDESLLGELVPKGDNWKKVPASILKGDDFTVTCKVDSISPIYRQEDKRDFMEFLAIITQYEVLSMSPALLREAAYKCGYKNERVLAQFQQLAQLAAIGRLVQAKQQVQAIGMPTGQPGAQPGQLAQQQTDVSTPPDAQQIANLVFNRQGVQQSQ